MQGPGGQEGSAGPSQHGAATRFFGLSGEYLHPHHSSVVGEVTSEPKLHKQAPSLEVLIDLPSWQELEIITKLT